MFAFGILQVHRRCLKDDSRGVGEPLNETGQYGDGLMVRGKHYVLLTTPDMAAVHHRLIGEQVYMQPSLMFTEGEADWMKNFKTTVSLHILYTSDKHLDGPFCFNIFCILFKELCRFFILAACADILGVFGLELYICSRDTCPCFYRTIRCDTSSKLQLDLLDPSGVFKSFFDQV